MRVVPLYTQPADPLASYRVTAPGGFERWELQAFDPIQRLQLSASFVFGEAIDGEYRRQYKRFLRNPTRNSPPLPAQFPLITCSVQTKERGCISTSSRVPPQEATASALALDVRFGTHFCRRETDGVIHLNIVLPAPGLLRMDLRFSPMERAYEVHGSIRFCPGLHTAEQNISLRGNGSIQHSFGTSPVTQALPCGSVATSDYPPNGSQL
jgi:hypothetical protein